MDRKQFIQALTLSAAVIALWMGWMWWDEKNHPPLPPQTISASTPVAPATQATTATPAATAPASSAPTTKESPLPTMHEVKGLSAVSSSVITETSIGSAVANDHDYVMQIRLTSFGAAVIDVTLNEFNAPANKDEPKAPKGLYEFETPLALADGTRIAALATAKVIIDGESVDLASANWTREPSAPGSARFSILIVRNANPEGGGQPVARVTKTFGLSKIDATKDTSKGYEVAFAQTVENLQADHDIKVSTVINGTTPPPAESDLGTDRNVVAGYAESDSKIATTLFPPTDFKPEAPSKVLTQEGSKRFVWVGQASTYFGAIVLPDAAANPDLTVTAEAKNPNAVVDRDIAITFESAAPVTIAPRQQKSLALTVFLGPKWRDVVADNYYSSMPRMYDLLLVVQSKMCAWCTWPWLISSLVWILTKFHAAVRDWGVAIIGLVFLVRLLLHPITKKSQVQMMKMGKLAPEVEKLKKKYADQPDVLNREMMKLYKEQGGAILGCLPMFLQTPIWIALWAALQGTFELRQAPFLYGWTWIHDLAKPDALFHFSSPIPLFLFGWTLQSINILPILMAIVTYINQKYFMPTPIAATPEQQQQQKIQRGMSLFFPLMFYSLPSGLNVYYLTSMSLGILESKIIRDHIKKQDELEKLRGPEIVSTKPTRASRRAGSEPANTKPPGLMARLIERAEQIRNEAKKGKGK